MFLWPPGVDDYPWLDDQLSCKAGKAYCMLSYLSHKRPTCYLASYVSHEPYFSSTMLIEAGRKHGDS